MSLYIGKLLECTAATVSPKVTQGLWDSVSVGASIVTNGDVNSREVCLHLGQEVYGNSHYLPFNFAVNVMCSKK